MSGATHVRYELLRSFRNPLMYMLTIALPLVLYYAIAPANRQRRHAAGISFPLYFMTGMAAYGAMFAAIGPGGRLARDRARGWTRQLRITPLRARTDYLAKVLAAYLVALPALVLVFLAGATLGVRLDAAQWLEMTGLLLVGLVPFILMGLILGHLIAADALVQVMGGLVVFFALFGGAFGSFFNSGAMLAFVKLLPSYWLVQAGKAALNHGDWPAEGWIVVACWTAALIPLAVLAYRHDTGRDKHDRTDTRATRLDGAGVGQLPYPSRADPPRLGGGCDRSRGTCSRGATSISGVTPTSLPCEEGGLSAGDCFRVQAASRVARARRRLSDVTQPTRRPGALTT